MFVNPTLISVSAANDSGFSERTPSGDPVPPEQLTFVVSDVDVPVKNLSVHLLRAERARVQRGEIAWGSWQVMNNRLDAHILPLLGDVPVKQVDARRAQELVDRLGAEGFSSTTIAQYVVLLRKLLAHAVLMGILAEVPALPRVKVRSQPRGAFGVEEYRRMVAVARSLRGQAHPALAGLGKGDRFWIARELLHMPYELPWLIRWMVNTFVRPSDIKEVKHSHIDVVRGRHLYLRMRLPETKRHSQPMVSLRAAVHVYESLAAHQRQQGYGGPNDYLFLPHVKDRGQALAILNFFFKWVLETAGLSVGPLGQKRTLYCLRHTAITFRLLYGQGIDMLTLARNARTSVNMIERFYASTLSGEMNVGLLQSRRGRKDP